MAGTRQGGKRAAAKNLEKDPNFYRRIGQIGGRNGNTGGFAYNPELASIAGAKGGRKSRRNYEEEFASKLAPQDRPKYLDNFSEGDQLIWRKSPWMTVEVTFVRYAYHQSIARSAFVQRKDRKRPTEVLESSLEPRQ